MQIFPFRKWKTSRHRVAVWLIPAFILLLFWWATSGSYVPYKDEDNYLRGAAEWLSGKPLSIPAFVPLHALLPEMLGDAESRWTLLRLMNVLWMSFAIAGVVPLARRLGFSRNQAYAIACIFLTQTTTLVSGIGMLAEPLALAGFIWGIVLLLGERGMGRTLAGAFLLGLAAMSRIEMFGSAVVFLIAWMSARPRMRWLQGLIAVLIVAGVWQLPSFVNWCFGAEYSVMRSHTALETGAGMKRVAPLQYLIGLWEFLVVLDSRTFVFVLRWVGLLGGLGMIVFKSKHRMNLMAVFAAGSAVLAVTSFADVARGDELVGRYYLPLFLISSIGSVGCYRLWKPQGEFWSRIVLGSLVVFGMGALYYVQFQSKFWPTEFLTLKREYESNPELRKLKIYAPFGGNEYSIGVRPELTNAAIPHGMPPEIADEFFGMLDLDLLIIQERWIDGPRTRSWAKAFVPDGFGVWKPWKTLYANPDDPESPALYLLRRDPGASESLK